MTTSSGTRAAPGRSGGSDDVRGWQDTSGGVAAADEGTALLNGDSQPRKDSWVGSEDFEGLSWWNRPSVRLSRSPAAAWSLCNVTRSIGHVMLTATPCRCGG